MLETGFLLILVGHVAVGVLVYGLMIHQLQDYYLWLAPSNRGIDASIATIYAVFGLLGLLIYLLARATAPGEKLPHGLRYKFVTEDEAWEDFQKKFPTIAENGIEAMYAQW